MRRTRFAILGVAALSVSTGAAAVVAYSTTAGAAPSPASSVSKAASGTAPDAGTRAAWDSAEQTGKATFYGDAGPGGNCSFPTPPADHMTTAAGPDLYAAAGGCGGYLDVTGAKGTVRVKIDNRCPECGTGHIDLSTEAFTRIDELSRGIAPITYRRVVDPPVSEGLSFRVKEGASQWWFALLVDNHGNPLKSVEVSSDGSSWQSLSRTDYNYWLAQSGAGQGPFTVRVTDVRGHVAVAANIAIRPGEVQKTSARLYGSGSSGSNGSGSSSTQASSSQPNSTRASSTRTNATQAGRTTVSKTTAPKTTVPRTTRATTTGKTDGRKRPTRTWPRPPWMTAWTTPAGTAQR
ncbi:MAG: expansin [Actinomycetota bacterium]|nr:expansin [Actinomycetota bacterium]